MRALTPTRLWQSSTVWFDADGAKTHPLVEERVEEKIRLTVVTADKGLCGAFNANVIKTAQWFLNENREKAVTLACIGRKGRDIFRRHRVPMAQEYINLSNLNYDRAKGIAGQLMQAYGHLTFDSIYIIYNEFKSVMQQRIVVERLLPYPASKRVAHRKCD